MEAERNGEVSRWHQLIRGHFPGPGREPVLVLDPDHILKEEKILSQLGGLGFRLVPYDDPVAFRYLYEKGYREPGGGGPPLGPAGRGGEEKGSPGARGRLLACSGEDSFNIFPLDLLEVGYRVDLRLSRLFPRLSYGVLEGLEPGCLGKVYEALEGHPPQAALGRTGTACFILRHIFAIDPDIIGTKVDLYKALLVHHGAERVLPGNLVKFLAARLASRGLGEVASLEETWSSQASFLVFWQEQFRQYINQLGPGSPAPPEVPFHQEEIQYHTGVLFSAGLLRPVEYPGDLSRVPGWALPGIDTRASREANRHRRVEALLQELGGYPGKAGEGNPGYKFWLGAARRVAEASLLIHRDRGGRDIPAPAREGFRAAKEKLQTAFTRWMLDYYGTLASLSYLQQPVMVHHIPRYLAYRMKQEGFPRVALLVLDGLALDQWLVIREHLDRARQGLKVSWHPLFAWVPTTTSVSRQAIFAGEPPAFFRDTLLNNRQEESLWLRFWQNEGLKKPHLGLCKGIDQEEDLPRLREVVSRPPLRVLGCVTRKLDKITHGQQQGTRGMLQDVDLWMREGFLFSLLEIILSAGFTLFLASDHGSVEATGRGIPREGVLVESKGTRTRVYQDPAFLEKALRDTPSIRWPNYGLPEEYQVLLAQGNGAYINEGEQVVSHGGISLEEVIVPFGKIERGG